MFHFTKNFVALALLLMLTYPSEIFSQNRFQGGIKVGTNITSYFFGSYDSDFPEYEIRNMLIGMVDENTPVSVELYNRNLMISFGGFASYRLKPWLSLRGGIEYSPKGERYGSEIYLSTNLNLESVILKHTTIFKLSYVEFPVSFQISPRSDSKPRNVYFFMSMGVAPALKLKSELDMVTTLEEQSFDDDGVVSKVIERDNSTLDLKEISATDLGILGSVGLEFKSMAVELKMTKGLINILEMPDEGTKTNFAANLSFSVSF
jgi:hypothetical protein